MLTIGVMGLGASLHTNAESSALGTEHPQRR